MNKILDIDLDFFLADCCPLADVGERPMLSGHEPWEESKVRNFLEVNCGLSKDRPIRGRVFETHDKALCMWDELIKNGDITIPFSVTHIDAHSDLGIGKPGPGFVLNTVISTRMDRRADIERYYDMHELDEANYLLFALGFRWIGELINIRNPKSHEDIPREIICVDETGGKSIKLSSFVSKLMENINGQEPAIPYYEYKEYEKFYEVSKYDIASLSISPRYAPREADALVDIISDYFIIM